MNDIKMLYDVYLVAEKNRNIACAACHTASEVASAESKAYNEAVQIYRAAKEVYDAAELACDTADDIATAAEKSYDDAEDAYDVACEAADDANKAYRTALSDQGLTAPIFRIMLG